MKKIMRQLFIGTLCCSLFLNLETAEEALKVLPDIGEMTKTEKNVPPQSLYEINPSYYGREEEISSSADELATMISHDLEDKNIALASAMNRKFYEFIGSLLHAKALLESAAKNAQLADLYTQLYTAYDKSQNLKVELAQFEQIKDTIEKLKIGNEAATTMLQGKYQSLDQDILDRKQQLRQWQNAINDLNDKLSTAGEQVILDQVATKQKQLSLLAEPEVRKIRIQQYKNLMGLLDLLSEVTQDTPKAVAAIKELKDMESHLHALDLQISNLESETAYDWRTSTFDKTISYERSLNLAKLTNLKKQYNALKEQYAKQMKAKYGDTLGQIAISKKNLFNWMRKFPVPAALIIVGSVVGVGMLTLFIVGMSLGY